MLEAERSISRGRRTDSHYGFTILELLIVIAIIGTLAVVLIPELIDVRDRALDSGAQACARSVLSTQEAHFIDHRTYDSLSKAEDSVVVADDANNDDGNVFAVADLASACTEAKIVIVTASADADGYSIDVGDARTSATFTVTQDSLTRN